MAGYKLHTKETAKHQDARQAFASACTHEDHGLRVYTKD